MPRADQSAVSLANRALSLIEADGIESLTEGSTRSIECLLWFDQVRDALIRAYPWNFSTERRVLPAQSASPAWGDGVYIPLPADCLRVFEVNGRAKGWSVEGRNLYTSAAPCEIRYGRVVEDPQQWDAEFALLFIHDLALAIGPKLAQLSSKLKRIRDERNDLMPVARTVDGRERAVEEMPSVPWVEAFS